MMRKRLTAVLCAVFMMTGCDGNKQEFIMTTTAQTSEVMTEAVKTEHPSAVRDIDPEAAAHGAEGMPYHFSADNCQVEFVPLSEAATVNGRYIMHNDVCYLGFTCSCVSFRMTGDRVEAVMVSNGGVYSERQQGWVGVMIDGELVDRIRLEDGEHSYVLYEGELDNAVVSIIKLSENQMASTGIKSITCNASAVSPIAEKPLKIEVIGDSITCGYGNEAQSPADGMDTAQQNGAATYGYLTARNLDADWSLVCISGIGLISDYTDTEGQKEDYLLVGDMYDYADANFQMRRGYDELTSWDFGRGSDVVVINIGTNDYSYTGEDEELQYEFNEAYYDFIGHVREKNPQAHIICTLGIMGAELYGQIEAAAEAYRADTGDEKIYTMKFDYQKEKDGYGGDYHPTVKTHEKAAEKLTEYIRTVLYS